MKLTLHHKHCWHLLRRKDQLLPGKSTYRKDTLTAALVRECESLGNIPAVWARVHIMRATNESHLACCREGLGRKWCSYTLGRLPSPLLSLGSRMALCVPFKEQTDFDTWWFELTWEKACGHANLMVCSAEEQDWHRTIIWRRAHLCAGPTSQAQVPKMSRPRV